MSVATHSSAAAASASDSKLSEASSSSAASTNSGASGNAKPTVKRGAFILFEGLDRSGKSTQCKLLLDNLVKRGHPAIAMRFPDRTSTIGKMLDAYLRNKSELEDHAVHLLFAANRWEFNAQMRSALESGKSLVVDRYSYSGAAFTSQKGIKGLDLDWCMAPERGLPAPDVVNAAASLVMYLTLPLEEAQKRGNYGEERYEQKETQARVAEKFEKLRNDKWKLLEIAEQTIKAVGDTPIAIL